MRSAEPALAPSGTVATRVAERRAAGEADTALLIVGLAGLPRVNERGGEADGDALLAGVADAIARFAMRTWGAAAGTVERLGGPRFALLPPTGTDCAALEAQTRALHDALAGPFAEDPGQRVSAQVAVVALNPALAPAAALRAAAAHAHRPAAARSAAEMRAALRGAELRIVWQPQFDRNDRCVGAEALARWHHPRRGILGAETLMRAAREAGMEVAVTRAIHDRALAEASAWPDALAALSIGLNVTAADLARPEAAATLIASVDAACISPGRVVVEVTEGAALPPDGMAAQTLGAVRAAGLRVAIDDFGSGYANLAWLKALPLDALKLDRTLVADLGVDGRGDALVAAVVAMGRALGLEVTAEGVETPAQRDRALALGCARWQGFLGGRPMPGTALVEQLLATGAR